LIASKVSKRYAKALLSIGQEDGRYEDYGKDLEKFAAFCSASDDFFKVVSNPIFSAGERKRILEYVLKKMSFSDVSSNFLRLLLQKERLGAIEEISAHYSRLTDDISGITRAEIITARPLEGDALKKLADALSRLTSRKVELEISVDESLIGGLVAKIGDLVLDGSIIAQLRGLKESLKRGEFN